MNDGLPQKICSTCELELIAFTKFRNRCKKVATILNEKYSIDCSRNERDCSQNANNHEMLSKTIKQEVDPIYDEYSNHCTPYASYEDHDSSISNDNTDKSHKNRLESTVDDYEDVKNVLKTEVIQSGEGKLKFHEVKIENNFLNVISKKERKECRACNETFTSTNLLKKHISDTHLNLINVDNHCTSIPSQTEKRSNFKTRDKVACNKCGKTLSSKRSLQRHLLLIHFGTVLKEFGKSKRKSEGDALPKRVSCSICQKQLKSRKHLKSHVSKYHFNVMHGLEESENRRDDDGGETLKIILSKASEAKKPKENNNYPQECLVCGKSVHNLAGHMQTHKNKIGDFKCDICQKPFKYKYSVTLHERNVHTKTNRTPCNICGKLYLKRSLPIHIMSHSSVVLFECDYCGKGFQGKQSFVHHIMGHMGMKPHKCSICSKRFLLKQVLQSHMLQHTGENPFKCELCPKVFKQRCNLKSHMKHYHKKTW